MQVWDFTLSLVEFWGFIAIYEKGQQLEMMMVEANEGSSVTMDGLFSSEDFDDDVVLDLDALLRVVGGHPDSPQMWQKGVSSGHAHEDQFGNGGGSEDLPFTDALKGEQTSAVLSTDDELRGFGVQSMPYNSEGSEPWRECSETDRLQSSSEIGQDNGLFYTFTDVGLQNDSYSYRDDSKQASFETLNHGEPFNFHSVSHVIPNRGSLDLNEIAPFETPSYGEPSSFYGSNSGIHERDSSDINLNQEEDIFGTTGYSDMLAFGNEWKNPFDTLSNNTVKMDIESIASSDISTRATDVVNGVIGRRYYGGPGQMSSSEGIEWAPSNSLSSISCNPSVLPQPKQEKKEKMFESRKQIKMKAKSLKMENGMPNSAFVGGHDWHPIHQVSDNLGILPNPSMKMETNSLKMENEILNSALVGHDKLPVHQVSGNIKVETNSLKVEKETPKIYQGVQSSTIEQIDVDDDADLCILEDMSAPAPPNRIAVNAKSVSRNPAVQTVTAHSRFKPNDERVIFRVALQLLLAAISRCGDVKIHGEDLTQPKSEATLPDGVLSVPLLKHQRIALSWMANKETKSACCSGGILADDQGLGKTVSTIALILKERSPSSKGSKINEKQSETETLNLDDDDDGVPEAEAFRVNGCPSKNTPLAKGRPSGGTLVVCPTSVLRQWSEELHNKVSREAALSVLIYYGSSRTKDPLELAKYDVVVTTYAIVSMEVPKQPVVNEDANQIEEFSSSGKRKLFETGRNSRSKKSKKGVDSELIENTYGPLAQVGWFRVVLDEAQSIKNHRTQVARACWGLRAKRRWCLSGTPIQNAIDDLYSYFRFLRHEPYAVFRTFCEQLKVPIHRNPRNGYKKLQAVLKTIMLRRTKGTFIEGEPIINLPPKTIELKKVDFSDEERLFYLRLEADSRAQFAEYAAAGTVKQNYVNILLMLLRLRQACDHPLLVKGFNSNSKKTSSIEMAKKLSLEKQKFLLSCLEASLAICGICSDPPEDAVVTVCGHVFCHQCICEHLIGDGTQCPSKKCKTHLSMACVFSIDTVRIALSNQPSTENTASCTDSEVAVVSEPQSVMVPQDSSKIKAALDILLSLSPGKMRVCCDSGDDNGISDMNRGSQKQSDNVLPEKAIVFSQWTGMLDLLEACLKNTPLQYRRLDGTMPVSARDRAVKDFNTIPQVTVMIMSLKAASLGLNMVAASNVLLLDLWWNPTTEDQAIDRAHRIGQTRPVSVYRLTVKETVEDRILALQQRKRKMVASAFGENETGSRQTRLTVDDLKYLFRAE
ncbi:putative swi/snf-related matrix-associated actin-dependent regulator of chromatin subfamily a member 3-like 2 [Phtheirospermum japonicum]|uniref:Putative swi/snf-related matrix-associated actin-dependent regulator of chromatin subfamily a member 3-like 2 n=1 Tax=Phtheirospermum japonicum TaxID=374723 RepID=A0A830CPU3_9LAMI|nr:putative swi/snf-related matrix-associated actin-dependent regulator of chromatin subfamily a member 3-like 2 [Phtheirospermum japonicum]